MWHLELRVGVRFHLSCWCECWHRASACLAVSTLVTLDPGKETITYDARSSGLLASFFFIWLPVSRGLGMLGCGVEMGKQVEGMTSCRRNYSETSILVGCGLVWGYWSSGGSGFLQVSPRFASHIPMLFILCWF